MQASVAMEPFEVDTPHGPARVHLHAQAGAATALVLGHGAGGSVSAPDLIVVTRTALEEGLSIALVEQPYRVAGRKSAAPAPQLDAAWLAVMERLQAHELAQAERVIAGGRSSGARVACRTAAAANAHAVLCLAFPLLPPHRSKPPQSRLPELDAVTVPVLVVQGESDQFGMPPEGPNRTVARLKGTHALKSDMPGLAGAVRTWLRQM